MEKKDPTKADASFRVALYNKERGRYEFAGNILTDLLRRLGPDPDADQKIPLSSIKKIRVHLLLAEALFETGNYTTALNVARTALDLSKTYRLLIAVAQSELLTSEILLSMKNPEEALLHLHAAIPRILAHGTLEDKGRVHLVTGKHSTYSDQTPQGLQKAIQSFTEARTAFQTLGAKRLEQRSLYCLARAHDTLGNSIDRDKYADAFIALEA